MKCQCTYLHMKVENKNTMFHLLSLHQFFLHLRVCSFCGKKLLCRLSRYAAAVVRQKRHGSPNAPPWTAKGLLRCFQIYSLWVFCVILDRFPFQKFETIINFTRQNVFRDVQLSNDGRRPKNWLKMMQHWLLGLNQKDPRLFEDVPQ